MDDLTRDVNKAVADAMGDISRKYKVGLDVKFRMRRLKKKIDLKV